MVSYELPNRLVIDGGLGSELSNLGYAIHVRLLKILRSTLQYILALFYYLKVIIILIPCYLVKILFYYFYLKVKRKINTLNA